jgi:hypothetical protein
MADKADEIATAIEKAVGKRATKPGSAGEQARARLEALAKSLGQKGVKKEEVSKELRAIAELLAEPGPRTKAMTLPQLVDHVVAELRKAAGQDEGAWNARLALLAAAVTQASTVLKQSFVDLDSEQIQVEAVQDDTTELADRSDQTGDVVAIEAAPAASGFASNPEALTAALEKLRTEIEALKAKGKPPKKPEAEPAEPGKGGEEKAAKRDPAWPMDLASEEFREGVAKKDLDWGRDPWSEE